ncbi:UDP-N-acetylglucosamine 2-epimerase [Pseudoalteromonas piscicida]|uniref:UDP-N-acetylglucosamine 2-epimerase n=1 Tax=Pseudoalteromonas piscicida TaxID=43662 RepID=UPI0032C1C6D2
MLNNMKRILFLTGTRADFGKIKSLISELCEDNDNYTVDIFVTGMHMLKKYGMTAKEVEKAFNNKAIIYKYINQRNKDSMDVVLSKTISGLSDYVKESEPDLIIVHGDRVEAMAGAIVGALNNTLVAHIEGGEVSGTIDELIRHAVTKMSHRHFVSNDAAKNRLLQLGECSSSIYVIGSPDIDVMASEGLPELDSIKLHYDIDFDNYAIFMYHPVTTEVDSLECKINQVIDSLLECDGNFIVIYPNNDEGSDIILSALNRLNDNERFCIFPSIRFESFLVLLKNSDFIMGNSSAGVREAPFYGLPTINIGTRQNNRSKSSTIIDVDEIKENILSIMTNVRDFKRTPFLEFGNGKSKALFKETLDSNAFWSGDIQKVFIDL